MIPKIILCILLTSFSLLAAAQSNLQFNKPILISYNGLVPSASTPFDVGTITVPPNKIWKIESGSAIDPLRLYPIQFNLVVDGQLLYAGSSTNSTMPYSTPPIWLGEGTYPLSISLSAGVTYNFIANISGIEFNLAS
jgi:hypothetical protein